ncbi:hypothetical protein [uncultured Amaricoccus sp.]|uniref:hypothetical protein n=1 Tax=uncultured Amaricoccus sp. TaxID=339341 RepID=UPI00263473CB|nr:hypothetical protein [uncultured Amaricoccus sp.]
MMTSGHAPTAMIADYAAGALSCGMSLVVASHLTYCPCCRDKAARLEALGGALLCCGKPVDPAPSCLERALARIEAPAAPAPAAEPRDPPLPRPLCRLAPRDGDIRWQPVAPGLAAFWLDGFPGERVGLLRARPGTPVAAGGPPAAALVIRGALRQGRHIWHPGELAFPAGPEAPEATGAQACLCLAVRPEPPPG